ncbi:MAG TPA: TlpA disulfide reductase family protein [Steroidobacteraceae bacterium]|nr:TlpA disulfide reductase family protein [Steroidobacteraceae bacterium]
MRIKTLLPALALAAAASVSSTATAADPIGQPAPAFSLPLRGGSAPLGLEKLRGQVVMVNFWASWCEPCRKEFPLLDQIYKKYKGAGFTLVGVNVEPEAKDAEGFIAKTPVTFPIVFDKDSAVSKLYHVSGMPTTVLIDRKGTLRWVHRSYVPGDENEYLNQVRAMLMEK